MLSNLDSNSRPQQQIRVEMILFPKGLSHKVVFENLRNYNNKLKKVELTYTDLIGSAHEKYSRLQLEKS